MRVVLSAVVVLAFAGVAGAGEDKKIDVKKLIGKWEPAVPLKNAKVVMEFAEQGKLTIQFTIGDKAETMEGTYKIDGNKIEIFVADGKEPKETYTVSKLTDDEMVGKDSKGKEGTLKKIKAK